MSSYDYIKGKERVETILKSKLKVEKVEVIPKENNFTYENAYYGWVGAIFVDIRDSTELFANKDKEKVSKVIRSFTSEIIEILREDEKLREIGIRGDCVYAVYATPKQDDVYELFCKTSLINTYMDMLNILLQNNNLPTIKVGIGLSIAEELVVKAGRKGIGINNAVWIGKAVTKASNLSSLGNKDNKSPICISELAYNNFIERLVKTNGEDAKLWFSENYDENFEVYYDANIINKEFSDWIKRGMKV